MPKRKITQEQAGEIRQLYSSGTITQTKLAEMYGISRQIINNIVNNKSYAKKEKGLKIFELRVEDIKKYIYSDNTNSDNTNNVLFSQFSFDERTMCLRNYYTYPPKQQKDLVKSNSFLNKEKYKLNKDEVGESRRRYYEQNKDKIREYHKQYYEQNKDKINERQKQKRIEQGQKTPKRISYKKQLMELLKEQGKI